MDIYEFLEIASEGTWKKTKHLEKLIELLLKLENREEKLALVNMPPRHGKSTLISIYFPIWYILKNPNHRVILTSYNSEFSSQFGSEILDIINSGNFDLKLSKNNKSKNFIKFENQKGSLSFVGAGGSLTGKGADLIIIDDPIKNDTEANSPLERDNLWNWFLSTVYTRLEPNGIILIVMTRWHKDDICGRLIKKFNLDGAKVFKIN